MSGKQVIFDRGDGNRFRIDANRIDWNKQRYPSGYVVTKNAVSAPVTPQAVLAADDVDAEDDEDGEPEESQDTDDAPRDLSIKELRQLAKDHNVSLPPGGSRRAIIETLRNGGVEVPEVEDLGAV